MLEQQKKSHEDCNCHRGGRAKILYQILKPENCPKEVFISVSDAHQYTNIYKITLNEQGKGTLLLEALKGLQNIGVCEENGEKVKKEISCYIDHMLMDEDEIHITYTDEKKDAYHELKFVEGVKEKNTLEIIKIEKDHQKYVTEINENKTFPFVLKTNDDEKQYELNKENHFSVMIHDVNGKEYTLNDEERNGYTRSLLHNCKECETIQCLDEMNSLQYIHTKNQASFMIHKLIRYGNDLRKPEKDACFKVKVTSLHFHEVIELNHENDFAYEFFDLPEGTYQVEEICTDEFQVSYMINQEVELVYANVVVKAGEDVSVTILNTKTKEEVELTLVKWIDGTDDLELPGKDDVFFVEVTICDERKEIELSCTNDWCQMIRVPVHTEICICEKNDEMLLVLDDCVLQDNCFTVSKDTHIHLINEKRYEENCSMMISVDCPQKESYRIQVRNECDRCCVILNEENDFCVQVTGLSRGIYHVYEVNGCSSFEINGSFYKEKGVVDICENCHSEVIVLSSENERRKGSIEISKRMIMDEKECLPLEEECFDIEILHEGNRETIRLYSGNDWRVCLEVDDGIYTIEELGAYQNVDYMVNGRISLCGEVCVEQDFHEVIIRNHVTCFNCITLTLWEFREEHLCPPQREHLIEFCGEQGKSVLFDSFHYHSMDFELMDGLYDVCADGMFDIYVNQQKESNPIKICKDTCIDLVFHEEFEQSTLQIFAWVRDENCDRIPMDESFTFMLCAKEEDRIILSDDNRFSFKFQNIPSGCYEIISCNEDYDVYYSMNGKCESDCGSFEIFQGHYQLDVILIPKKKGSLYVRGISSGTVYVVGDNYYEEKTADEKKEMKFEDLEEGYYEIFTEEQHGFWIDGSESEKGIFLMRRKDIFVDMMNNNARGTIRLQKFIRNTNGDLIAPAENEMFQIRLVKDGRSETYTLDFNNNFIEMIDVSEGKYQIIEDPVQGYRTTYVVNREDESDTGSVCVEEGRMQRVSIINEAIQQMYVLDVLKFIMDENGRLTKPQSNESFQFRVSGPSYQSTIRLDATNNWFAQILGLSAGMYTISEVGNGTGYQVQYRVNGGELQDRGVITLQPDQENTVEVINHHSNSGGNNGQIYFDVMLENRCKDVVNPSSDDEFTLEVTHNNRTNRYLFQDANDFRVHLANLEHGLYTFAMSDAGYSASFEIDGKPATMNPRLEITDGMGHQVRILMQRRMMQTRSNDRGVKVSFL